MVAALVGGLPGLCRRLVIVLAIFARRLGVIPLIVLRDAFLADQVERVEWPDWLLFAGADASVACLTALDGPSVDGRARWALPLLSVDPSSAGIRHRLCAAWTPTALIESWGCPAR